MYNPNILLLMIPAYTALFFEDASTNFITRGGFFVVVQTVLSQSNDFDNKIRYIGFKSLKI